MTPNSTERGPSDSLPEHTLPDSLIGDWRLVSLQVLREDFGAIHPYDEDAEGSLIFTPGGRFSIHLVRADRPRFASGDQMKGTPEEYEAAYRGVITHYGRYQVDEPIGPILYHIERSLFPNWECETHSWTVELEDDTLTLTTPPLPWAAGGEVVGVHKWVRIRDAPQ